MNGDDLYSSDTPAPSLEEKLALEGPFISADDAAFWAHKRIDKHDVEYGGAILQKGGRFYASSPIMGEVGGFAPSDVIDIGDDGKLILPPGYSCHAFYHSHPANDEKFRNTRLTEDQRVIVRGMFSFYDIEIIIQFRQLAAAHYLCGPDGSLIKYVTSGTKNEREFLQRISPDQRSTLDVFDDYIPLMAEAGELWVIVANRAWGDARGRVDKSWKQGTVLSSGAMQPLFRKVLPEQGFQHLLPANAAVVFGYQLKAVGKKDEYLVPTQGWERGVLTPPAQLFPQRADGGVRLASNFRINAIYCRPPPPETWQHPYFFTPTLLAAAAEQLRVAPELYDRDQRLSLVMRSDDGALLAYRFSATDGEAGLLGTGGARVEAQLKARTMTPRQFVERLAAIGELDIVQAGTEWREIGRFQPEEPPFEQLMKTMSPAFITADDAARYLHERISSRDEDQLGLVLERDDGRFVSTAPLRESALSTQLGLAYDGAISTNLVLPSGYRVVGFFVALANQIEQVKRKLPLRTNVQGELSLDDEALLYTAVPNYAYTVSITAAHQTIAALYYASPFNSLIKYVRSGSEAERNFSAFLKEGLRLFAIKPQLDGFDGTCVEMVRKLVRLGEFHVLESSSVWGNSLGRVPGVWAPYQSFVAAGAIAPAYSWVFADAQAAAQYGQDQQSTSGNPLAFIIKSQQAEAYVVTRPAALRPGLPVFSTQQVMDELPAGYDLYGVCFSPRPPLGLKIVQHWLLESFISSGDLAAAIARSRLVNSPLRVLYLNTRDGARLKYTFSGTPQENQLYGIAPTGTVTDNGQLAALIAGQLTPQQFVLKVAAAGELFVLRTGTMWDVEGVVRALWRPHARYPSPVLSPPFLSADDAARFAHDQVGNQRDVEFCGVILQTADQRYVATLPWPCRAGGRFAADSLLPVDHSGTLIVPTSYTLHGQYASCKAAALLERSRMSRYGWSRDQAYVDWQLFTDADLRSLIGNRHKVSVAYLSCAENALIAYDLSGSEAELALLKSLEPGTQGSVMEQRRGRGEVPPEAMVRTLATTGLRIVLGSPLWGTAGVVTEHWRAFPAIQDHQAPEQVGYGAVFSSADEAARHAHSRVSRGYGSAQTCFAFVLKHAQKDEYLVSETVPGEQGIPLFSLASLFVNDDAGAYVYPSGFGLHGLFYARRWMPELLPSDQQWLARHFLSSADLYSGFEAARRWRSAGSLITLPVYISTLDNALLKYQSPVSTRLFDAVKQASGNFEDVHTLLASGQLTAQGFVTQVCTQSWLTVIIGNDCWDETGKLSVDWLPYADFNRRALSPAFFSQADAVRYAQARLGVQREDVFGGLILRRVDGLFVATEPMLVPSENFDPQWILPSDDVLQDRLAPSMKLVARYRSRCDTLPAFLLDTEELAVYRSMFSTEVLAKAFASTHLWSHEYLLGLDGSLIGFSCSDIGTDVLSPQQKARIALDRQTLQQNLVPSGQTPHDPHSNLAEQQLRDGSTTPTEYVNQVLKAASMQVIQGSDVWGSAQALSLGWRIAHGYVEPEENNYALADRACGPVFSHIDDVARHIHGQAGDRSALTFGFILKAANGHWMATLPVKGEDLQFPKARVWLRGQLPLGCSVQGLYVCAPARQPDELGASPIYRSFVNPTLLLAALTAVRQVAEGVDTFLPLYLSCADSALLKYSASGLIVDWTTYTGLQAYVKKLNGPYNAADYIRDVARHGTLEVLVTGEIWATQGRVSQRWTAYDARVYTPREDERIALGPLFSHADDAARYLWRGVSPTPGKAWMAALIESSTASTFLVTDPVDDSGPTVEVGARMSTSAFNRLLRGVVNQREPKVSPKYPAGYRLMGIQQLYKVDDTLEQLADRHEEALASNFMARKEIRFFVEMFKTDNVKGARYYFTPRNGALLMYLPSYLEAEGKLLREDWPYHLADKPSHAITTLANSGKLYILEPDGFWQPRGQVGVRLLMELRKTAQA
ncbi:DUF4329 domain-containing protein [Pseudomonas sp. TE24901]